MTGLAIEDLRVRLGGRVVVDRLSLALPSPSLAAIVGPNGAGKTSLLRALVGLLAADGSVTLGGQDLLHLPGRERARRIAYLPQRHEAHWPIAARDIVALGRIPHGGPDPARLGESDRAAIADAMDAMDVSAFADRPVTALSGGERARVALARVLAVGAPLILADEPTAALDPRHQLDVMQALRKAAERGAIVLAVTHDLGLAARFADRVIVMDEARVAAFGSPEEALSTAVLQKVFGISAYRADHAGVPVIVPWA